ncbi:hypothetical protein [Pelagibaculum spongiae]|uniref:Uncharacterized protein n=1 Tax=Pelagibaculum spongiae TaxID=2080658 RepID=A0A2V1H1F6_9GAMM|nr:hypothetical protein [Pelagibaculum spongiae]PVZ72519.1 hypothetical protein DC094_05825 [Pelagibaculum spongiae]
MNKKIYQILPLVVLLSACGGGGSSESGNISAPEFSIEAVAETKAEAVDLKVFDSNLLAISIHNTLSKVSIDWNALGKNKLLNLSSEKQLSASCTREGDVLALEVTDCGSTRIEIKQSNDKKGFSQLVREERPSDNGYFTTVSVAADYKLHSPEAVQINEKRSIKTVDDISTPIDASTASVDLRILTKSFTGQAISQEDHRVDQNYLLNSSVYQSISGRVATAQKDISYSYTFERIARSEEAQKIQPASPLMFRIASAGSSLCLFTENENNQFYLEGELNVQLDKNCNGVVDNMDSNFTIESLPEYQAAYIDLDLVKPEDIANILHEQIASVYIDWPELSKKGLIDEPIERQMQEECHQQGSDWTFNVQTCNDDETEFLDRKESSGYSRELRFEWNGENLGDKDTWTVNEQYSVKDNIDLHVKLSKRFTLDFNINQQVYSDTKVSIMLDGIFDQGYQLGVYQFNNNALSANKYEFTIDSTVYVKTFSVDNVSFNGAFDFKSVLRSEQAKIAELGSSVMYEITSQGKNVCLFSKVDDIDIAFEPENLLVDSNCDGVSDGRDPNFTIAELPELEAEYIDLDSIDLNLVAKVLDNEFGNIYIDWADFSEKEYLEFDVSVELSDTCTQTGGLWGFTKIECTLNDQNVGLFHFEESDYKISNGFSKDSRDFYMADNVSYISNSKSQYVFSDLIEINESNYFGRRSGQELSMKKHTNIVISIDKKSLFTEGYNVFSHGRFEKNYLSAYDYEFSATGTIKLKNGDYAGVSFSGAFDFEAIVRSDAAQRAQTGSKYMYKITSQEKEVCLFLDDQLGLTLSDNLAIDPDCDGITEVVEFSLAKAEIFPASAVDLDSVDPEFLKASAVQTFRSAFIDWQRMINHNWLSATFVEPPLGGCQKDALENFTIVKCVNDNYGLLIETQESPINQSHFSIDFRQKTTGLSVTDYLKSSVTHYHNNAGSASLNISAGKQWLENADKNQFSADIQLSMDLVDFSGENLTRSREPFEYAYLNPGWDIGFSAQVKSRYTNSSNVTTVGAFDLELIARSEASKVSQKGSPLMAKFSSQGKSFCMFSSTENGYEFDDNTIMDMNCDGIAE